MRRLFFGLALALGVLAWFGPAGAHHSTAMFDRDTEVTLEGTIEEFQWTNPHAWIQVAVPGPGGELVEWSIECGSPNTLSRRGWTPSMLTPGETVSIVANTMKDGTPAALFVSMTLADGRVFGRGATTAGGESR